MATILVVDDEPDIRALVQLNLELDGHEVITASNGAEALELVADQVPDVMLLDLMMPEVDGWTVLETIKAAGDLDVNRIPVLSVDEEQSLARRFRGEDDLDAGSEAPLGPAVADGVRGNCAPTW